MALLFAAPLPSFFFAQQALAAPGCSDLFSWLQGLDSDRDFTAAVEMAMGRSELETPPELWVSGATNQSGDELTGEPKGSERGAPAAGNLKKSAAVGASVEVGRPDEEKLSMLASLRTSFYGLLFRDVDR